VLVVDETSDLKQGVPAPWGCGGKYTGTAGRIETAQAGIVRLRTRWYGGT
jgi:hypothetical protein